MADLMQGLASAFPGFFAAQPLHARTFSFGRFTMQVPRLRVFSSSHFAFEGAQAGGQLLELAPSVEGGGSVESLRLAIVRTR
jgi:hypothetical protein